MTNVRSPRPDTMSSPPLILRRRRAIRAGLLGTVAALALAGMNDVGFNQAHAAALQSEVSPVSFADVVDHVRGAVVSVKVKTTETQAFSNVLAFRTLLRISATFRSRRLPRPCGLGQTPFLLYASEVFHSRHHNHSFFVPRSWRPSASRLVSSFPTYSITMAPGPPWFATNS
jgi:S1-C subfamily serine protease